MRVLNADDGPMSEDGFGTFLKYLKAKKDEWFADRADSEPRQPAGWVL